MDDDSDSVVTPGIDPAEDSNGVPAENSNADTVENPNADTAENSDGDWTFGLKDLAETDDSPELQPGSPKLEHAAFVFLGVLATLFAIFRTLFG